MCNTISNCLECPKDKSLCSKCYGSMKINVAVTPNECVTSCPAKLHEANGRCYPSQL